MKVKFSYIVKGWAVVEAENAEEARDKIMADAKSTINEDHDPDMRVESFDIKTMEVIK